MSKTTSKTEIVFILDKSGSMNSIKSDAIGGFNAFIEEQLKSDGETNVTLVLFDSEIQTLNDIHSLTEETFKPSGLTALIDAIGVGVDGLNKRVSEMSPTEQPDNVVFAIMTDGHENASRNYSIEAVKNKIQNMQNRDYQFLFLGANIDAVETAKGLGIRGEHAGGFVASSAGMQTAMLHASEMVLSYRDVGKMMSYAEVSEKIDKEDKGE